MKISSALAAKCLAMADAAQIRVSVTDRHKVSFTVPCRVVSEANQREHWRAAYKRKTAQKEAAYYGLYQAQISDTEKKRFETEPITVTLVRNGGRKMDSHDNFVGAFKYIVDAIAEFINRDDGDAGITWRYEHKPGKEQSVSVTIERIDP